MAEMDWEVHLDAERRKLLLRLCLRVTDGLEAAAAALCARAGPYQLYLAPTLAPPAPFGTNGDDAALLAQVVVPLPIIVVYPLPGSQTTPRSSRRWLYPSPS